MSQLRLAINGAAGRMGRRLVALGTADPELKIVAALEWEGCAHLGKDAGTLAGVGDIALPITAVLEVDADVMIDFSLPSGAEAAVKTCLANELPLVLATTGLSAQQVAMIHEAAKKIPLLWAPNMSLAVNLTMRLAQMAAKALVDQDADVEILERHHRFKEDSPSGTALKFGEIIAAEMGQTKHRHGREGRCGSRPHDEIGYHAIRVGDDAGQHTIVFGMLGETVELTVRASNRDCYACGAFAAARYLAGRPVGLYSMADVLGLG